jgi:two-component system, response regulator PdtaR
MGEPGRPSAAVLIVEDEPLIRMGAVSLIEDAGFEVYEAGSADAAIALLERHEEIRLIFTDVDMPGSMDGLKLASPRKACRLVHSSSQNHMSPLR